MFLKKNDLKLEIRRNEFANFYRLDKETKFLV